MSAAAATAVVVLILKIVLPITFDEGEGEEEDGEERPLKLAVAVGRQDRRCSLSSPSPPASAALEVPSEINIYSDIHSLEKREEMKEGKEKRRGE